MYPFFDLVIEPVLSAAGAKRVVEIGALRGETTALMLEKLGPESELHVIDPVPAFGPSDHERQFPGRYLFYRDLSHAVLPDLPAMDAALIDGDHNWYTVFHELRLLSENARAAGAPLPVMIMHDVGWPYGRRDLYYDPSTVPDEFRQPWAEQGIERGQSELLDRGGVNPTMCNATHEGGPRNGVLTALDDFVAGYDRPVRTIVLPVYFGLAIVVEEAVLAERPALAERLDWLLGAEGEAALAELAEDVRLYELGIQHRVFFNAERRQAKSANLYLGVLKSALLNEHYLEHELRIDHLLRSIDQGFEPNEDVLRDPRREMKDKTQRLLTARRAGQLRDAEDEVGHYFPYASMGRTRLDHLQACLDTIRGESVGGDLVAIGAGRGGAATFLRGYLEGHNVIEPKVWVVDDFLARPAGHASNGNGNGTDRTNGDAPLGGGRGLPDLHADLNNVRDAFARFDLLDKRVRFVQGPPALTLPDTDIAKVALLHVGDADGIDLAAALDAVYDRLSVGGYVVVERYGSKATRQAIDEFRARRGIEDPIEQVDWAGAAWRKLEDGPETTAAVEPGVSTTSTSNAAPDHAGAPLAPPVGMTKVLDLSVVVVFYNMKREAQRTLHSLSRAYQQGLDGVEYEVIVVENGSAPEQKLGKKYVRSFGPEFVYIDMAADAVPSPVHALNVGIARSRGAAVAIMIDGAHVLTPNVLRFGLLGIRSYAPAVVTTQQWYVGPGQQGEAMVDGYDRDYEDRLFDEIEWPGDGYRLFEIGHFIGDRDWLDGLWESNCLFVPRSILEQVGGLDEGFSIPGGEYANLELYERIGATPDVTSVTILGEGSFHQVHGGTTTNMADVFERHRRLASYSEHYRELRGRDFRGHGKTTHYVGSMPKDAARTRSRRRTALQFFTRGAADGIDGIPRAPVPMPQDQRTDFIEGFWRSLRWRQTTWLGRKVAKAPTDLFAYQELVHRVKPDWIVETGTGNGGRAMFLASICDLVGHGRVISIDKKEQPKLPRHDRVTYLAGAAHDPAVVEQVRALVGPDPKALVILGSRVSASRTTKEFEAYAPLVPTDSYVIVEDTILNGHPVWADFGNGPAEMVRNVVEQRGDFVADLEMEKYLLTFNPGGFLRRVNDDRS